MTRPLDTAPQPATIKDFRRFAARLAGNPFRRSTSEQYVVPGDRTHQELVVQVGVTREGPFRKITAISVEDRDRQPIIHPDDPGDHHPCRRVGMFTTPGGEEKFYREDGITTGTPGSTDMQYADRTATLDGADLMTGESTVTDAHLREATDLMKLVKRKNIVVDVLTGDTRAERATARRARPQTQ